MSIIEVVSRLVSLSVFSQTFLVFYVMANDICNLIIWIHFIYLLCVTFCFIFCIPDRQNKKVWKL